jgi:hypothetical protein
MTTKTRRSLSLSLADTRVCIAERLRRRAAITSHAAWLYFPLSSQLAEEMLAVRGIIVGHETQLTPPVNQR